MARRTGRADFERNVTHALFVTPSLLLYTLFSVFPIFIGIYYSFTNWNGFTRSYKFIGFHNYVKMMSNSRFLRAISFNGRYVLMYNCLPAVFMPCAGLLLNQKFAGAVFSAVPIFFRRLSACCPAVMIFRQILATARRPSWARCWAIESLKNNILADPDLAISACSSSTSGGGSPSPRC